MKLVELHILQSFPVTCLNRDDAGAPKSAWFGGVQRARVSSQCWKRAIRHRAKEICEQYGKQLFGGIRSHYLEDRLHQSLMQKGMEESKARDAAKQIVEFLGKRDSKQEGAKTTVALFFSPKELDAIAEAVLEQVGDKQDKKIDLGRGKLKKMLQQTQPDDLADIAIFGRMVANDHTLTVEGAGLFSHALSTHEVANDVDYFSAVDEEQPELVEGAGHIGTLEFNTACYYRYIGLNWDLLSDPDHIGALSPQDREQVLDVFLRASILAVPNARKTSMFGHNMPGAVLGLVRRGHPLSLANAFERPIGAHEGYLKPSLETMAKHYATLKRVFSLPSECELWLLCLDSQQSLKLSVGTVVDNLDTFVQKIKEALRDEPNR